MSNILNNLNNKQIEAITSTHGPVLIIAGPGSGKTRVLTHRIAYMIEEKIAKPGNILAVTFTNKAAREMRYRTRSIISLNYPQFEMNIPLGNLNVPTIGTFHSLCLRILRQEADGIGFDKDFVVFDDDDQSSLIRKTMKELLINAEQINPSLARHWISNAKNQLKRPDECENAADDFLAENISKIYKIYQQRLKENNAFDFDDLIMKTVELFEGKPEILKKYQSMFKFVMVDEYQDTNHAQYRLINHLGKAHRNLCVVGDDWQSIYRWRGADIANILEFENNYPEAKIIMLEQNYRSTQNILDAAYGVISKNINRKDKKLWTEDKKGEQILAYEAADEKGEAEYIVLEIAKLNNGMYGEKVNLEEVAVLYRTNAQSRSIEEAFLKYNVPYKIVGGIKFYMRKEIKDIIAYFRFIQNPGDSISFERIINIPARGIGKSTLMKVLLETKSSGRSIIDILRDFSCKGVTKGKSESLKNFSLIINKCQKQDESVKTLEYLDYMIKTIGYEKYLRDGTEEGETRWENVKELFSAMQKYEELPWREGVKLFLEEVSLATDLDNIRDDEKSVTLMTLHSAKGLEYNTVFIIGFEEGLLPHARSIDIPLEMEEERRLCYVGITRAKKRVYLVFARVRKIFGSTQINSPSRFIGDIPDNLIDFKNQGYSFVDSGSGRYKDYEDDYIDVD